MKLLQKASAFVLAFALLTGCAAPAETGNSLEDGPSSGILPPQDELNLLMERYVLPYEFFAMGQNWDFSDPAYFSPADPKDLAAQDVHVENLIYGYALGSIVRLLPAQEQEAFIHSQNGFGTGYIVTADYAKAVGEFFFGTTLAEVWDSPYGEDTYPDGRPSDSFGNSQTEIALQGTEVLENGDVALTIDRINDGRKLLSSVYTLRPFAAEEVPEVLASFCSVGDTAYRFVSVVDIPAEAETKTVELSSPEDLRELAQLANSGDASYYNTTYLLAGDIDMAGEDLEPIGSFSTRLYHDSAMDGFNAVFDGQGFSIQNLTLEVTPTDPEQNYQAGLFATIGRQGVVQNLNVQNCNITLNPDIENYMSSSSAGGLAGTSFGTVSHCNVTGKVSGISQVGGLIGISGWLSWVENSTADAVVTGGSEIGGLIGSLHNAAISNSKALGEVRSVPLPYLEGVPPRGIGGFAGFMVMGTVQDCHSEAFVKTTVYSDWVGGFMGYNQGEIRSSTYNAQRTANWEAVDVIYNDAISDVKPLSQALAQPEEPAEPKGSTPAKGDIVVQTSAPSYPVDAAAIEVQIINNTSEEIFYGLAYRIEREQNGTWEVLPLEFEVLEIAMVLSPGKTGTENFSLWQTEQPYAPGKYRIVLFDMTGGEHAAEFTLA